MESLIGLLDDLLRQHRPAYYQRLLPAATAGDILALESCLGVALPPAFKSLYLWRNGQPSNLYESWQNNQTLMSLAAIREAHDVLTGLLREGEFERARWWHPQWIPFLDNGGGDHFCVDLAGVFTGDRGQIIEFRHDNPIREIVAPNFKAWLAGYVDLIQNEDWEYYEETGDELYLDWDSDIEGYPIRAEATSVIPDVNALEYARWQLNDIHRSSGSAADYLDRGRPDPDQRAEAKAAIKRLESEAVQLENTFDQTLTDLRIQNPAVVFVWVATHVEVLNDIIGEARSVESLAVWDKTRIHVAEKTLAEWQEVKEGKRNYVSINWYFLKDYEERLTAKLPGLKLREPA